LCSNPIADAALSWAAGMIVSLAGQHTEMWLRIYGAAFGGWLLSIAVPMVWQVTFELVLGVRKRR